MSVNGFHDKITWSNFKKVVEKPPGATEDAKMHWLLSFDNVKHINDNSVSISSVEVFIKIYKEGSWVLENKQVDSLLAHEQGHYDIVAIQAREFHKRLRSLKAKAVHELQVKASGLLEKSRKDIDNTQGRYDSQTDHSQISDMQQKWLKIIDTAKKNPNGTLDDLPQ